MVNFQISVHWHKFIKKSLCILNISCDKIWVPGPVFWDFSVVKLLFLLLICLLCASRSGDLAVAVWRPRRRGLISVPIVGFQMNPSSWPSFLQKILQGAQIAPNLCFTEVGQWLCASLAVHARPHARPHIRPHTDKYDYAHNHTRDGAHMTSDHTQTTAQECS